MPFGISSITDIRRRPSVQAMSGGGYQMAETPDPNDAMETYRRSHTAGAPGPQTMSQMPEQTADVPLALGQNLALADRGYEEQSAMDEEDFRERGRIRNVRTDPRWMALSQALKEQGADRLRTGAAAGWQNPGFMDQGGPTPGVLNRQNQVDAFMANFNAGAFQDERRRR